MVRLVFFDLCNVMGSHSPSVIIVPAIIIDNEDVGQSSSPIIATELRSHNDGSVISVTNTAK